MTESTDSRASASRRLALLGQTPVAELPGIGPRVATSLAIMQIESVLDLLMFYPRDWVDRSNNVSVTDLVVGELATVQATVRKVSSRRLRGRMTMVQVTMGDDDDNEFDVTFFNQPWRVKQLAVDTELVATGKIGLYKGRFQMNGPRLDILGARDEFRETGRIMPIYPQSEKAGIASHQIARFVEKALEFADKHDAFIDPISEKRLSALQLISRSDAFHYIHFPVSEQSRIDARRRLAFDELWRLQVVLVMRKMAALASSRGISHAISKDRPGLVEEFIAKLSFPLTGAQHRAIAEIANDLRSPHPMHRLLQGDVGAGKTVVALASLLYGVQGGYQGALMVPTEVLAEQHLAASLALLEGLEVSDSRRLSSRRPVTTALLTAKTSTADRKRLLKELANGEIDLLVGTHALLTDDVRFSSLGVVVIDEQHRFGVDQRAALREKGSSSGALDPDLLVMTATPIPRTAAMTVYGDLDMSTLDELPKGRSPITTYWIGDEDHSDAWGKVREEVARGNAAFVVCPLVRTGGDREEGDEEALVAVTDENSDRLFEEGAETEAATKRSLHSATEEFARLSGNELFGLRLGLLHGQLPAKEKDRVMSLFRNGDLDVLVATTVIEVGIDIRRATVMVIEDADRFGIAQLHQLRGRVGRGDQPSFCYLLAPEGTPFAAERLGALVESTDGFYLADVDLELRGEGTVLGSRQKGRNDLRLASLRRDRDLVTTARNVAEDVLRNDPTLSEHPLFAEELRQFIDEQDAIYLFRS